MSGGCHVRRSVTGQPLLKPRHTRLEPIAYQERRAGQPALNEAATEYAHEGYNRAIRERKGHVGFLMILMQRLVTSSTRAIRVRWNAASKCSPHRASMLFRRSRTRSVRNSMARSRSTTGNNTPYAQHTPPIPYYSDATLVPSPFNP